MVRSIRRTTSVSAVRPYVETLTMVAASTLVGALVEPGWGNSAVDLIYLPTVLAAAGFYGLGPGIVAAIASALSFNYYFTQPIHTLRISNAEDIATVGLLFLVALVTSQLAARMRAQALAARTEFEQVGKILLKSGNFASDPGNQGPVVGVWIASLQSAYRTRNRRDARFEVLPDRRQQNRADAVFFPNPRELLRLGLEPRALQRECDLVDQAFQQVALIRQNRLATVIASKAEAPKHARRRPDRIEGPLCCAQGRGSPPGRLTRFDCQGCGNDVTWGKARLSWLRCNELGRGITAQHYRIAIEQPAQFAAGHVRAARAHGKRTAPSWPPWSPRMRPFAPP